MCLQNEVMGKQRPRAKNLRICRDEVWGLKVQTWLPIRVAATESRNDVAQQAVTAVGGETSDSDEQRKTSESCKKDWITDRAG